MAAANHTWWGAVVYERMVRTNEIRLAQRAGQAAQLLRQYVDMGFFWLPFTLERIKEYEANRAKYPTYKSFIHRMFAVFDETEPVIANGSMVGVRPRSL